MKVYVRIVRPRTFFSLCVFFFKFVSFPLSSLLSRKSHFAHSLFFALTMASFTSLPQEIIDLIVPLVNPKDYASCVRVSHEWYTLFTPSLWRDIRLVDETINERFKTKESRRALARNAQHLRIVETTDPAFVLCLGSFMPPVTNLQSLTIRLKDHPNSAVTELVISDTITIPAALITGDDTETVGIPRCVDRVIRVLEDNSDLQHLSLDVGCFRYKDGREGFADLVAAIPIAKLEKLELSFLQSIPRNQEIHEANAAEIFDIQKVKQYYLAKHDPFVALKEVVITGGSQNSIDPNRLFFLVRCPNIETIRLHRLDDTALHTIPVFVNFACHKLINLEWRKSVYDLEDEIEGLLRLTKEGWKELRLPDIPQFGAFAFEALMDNIDTLEVLRFESSEELQQNAFLDFLCSARKLRRLEGIVDRQRKRFTSEVCVNAQDAYIEHVEGGMGDRSWVLGPAMEHLQLRIQDVPRPDVVYRQSGGELMIQQTGLDPALRFDVQRWIYTQVGRMTGLRELILGVQDLSTGTMKFCGVNPQMNSIEMEEAMLETHVHAFNYLSLEFSLESGLGLLAGLKEMRMLDVRCTAHYIGVAELEWMHTNWPKLERIRGLESDRRWSVHHAEGPAAKTAVEEWMAAHPRGIGSSFYL